jgi:signal transduction histidine kinase
LADSAIVVSIEDNGVGIAAEHIRSVLEPFFTTKDVGEGTGLGLTISYDIIKRHKGELLIDSQVGVGTTFTIRIPVDFEALDYTIRRPLGENCASPM